MCGKIKIFPHIKILNKMLHTKSYFCNTYHSCEKGMVENMNGLIRRFLPKRTDFYNITDEEIKKSENQKLASTRLKISE